MFALCDVTEAQQSTTIEYELSRPRCTSQPNWDYDGPNPGGVGGWGSRSGPGSRGRGPAPILLRSRHRRQKNNALAKTACG